MLASRNPSARARATSWALATLVDDVFDDDQQFHEVESLLSPRTCTSRAEAKRASSGAALLRELS
jgi:hypothetical protein